MALKIIEGKKKLELTCVPRSPTFTLGRLKGLKGTHIAGYRSRCSQDREISFFPVLFVYANSRRVDRQVLKSEYTHPKFKGEPFELGEQELGMKIYTGGCHCGAVTIVVKSKPLAEI